MSFVNSFDGFIFDYGGVLVKHQTRAEQEQMAKIAGLSMDQFEELYWKNRAEYDRGVLTGVEYWLDIGQGAGRVLTMDQITKLIDGDNTSWMNYDEPMWDFVEELKSAGKRVAILSNMPSDLGEALKLQKVRFSRFDHVTLSYELQSVKPEAAIYEECLAGLRTVARKTVFFDDRMTNVRGAEMLGITGVEFLDRDTVLRRMRGPA